MRKHEKPFKCDAPGCTRKTGFTTINDLNRHSKSVHEGGIDGKTKSFKCAAKSCRTPNKVWPRLDNFKQHVTRLHPTEDAADLIKR
jgi:hypothetical protein